MYPQFKLLVDTFKDQEQDQKPNHDLEFADIPTLESQDSQTYSQQEYDKQHEQQIHGDQRIEQARLSSQPNAAEEVIRSMLDNISPEEMDMLHDLRHIQKPKSFNKKKDKNNKRKSAPEYHAPHRIVREVSPEI